MSERWIAVALDQDDTRLRVLAIEETADAAHVIAERERGLVLNAVSYRDEEPPAEEETT